MRKRVDENLDAILRGDGASDRSQNGGRDRGVRSPALTDEPQRKCNWTVSIPAEAICCRGV
jgi:hypothetical protein